MLTSKRILTRWARKDKVLISTLSDFKLVDSSGASKYRSGKPYITVYNLTAGTSGLGFFSVEGV
jgi:hypothetical protein